ncbi:ABC transporter permease [Xylanibacillus composti]|nr:ABC transporter permease [Xylanibacillus composti]
MFVSHLKITLREKQAWFWGIFFPIILMVLFMLIFSGSSDSSFSAEVAIVEENPNAVSQALLQQISQIPALEVKSGEPVSQEQADHWVKEKDVTAAIVLPNAEDVHTLQLIVNKEQEQGVSTQAIFGILDKLVQQANLAAAGAAPTYELQFEAVSSGNENLKYEDFLLTGMIALAIAQGGLFGMVDMVEMRRKGLLKRLRMTPAKMSLFGLSDMTMRMIFGLVQIIVLSLIGVLAFGATLHLHLPSLILVFLVGALSFNAMGYLFSSFSKTTEAYMGMANIASFLMMFLSGVFFPVETMPEWLQPVAVFLPLTYFVDNLRESMVYATGLGSASLWSGLGILALWGAATFLLGSWLYKAKSIAAAR